MTPKVVLVVDDSAVMKKLTSAVLESGGYRTVQASDGAAALGLARDRAIDLVLTDWTMPTMGGYELICHLRLLPDYADVPILVLTTETSDASKTDARRAGASGWLCKPIAPEVLLKVVGSLISHTRPPAHQ